MKVDFRRGESTTPRGLQTEKKEYGRRVIKMRRGGLRRGKSG